MLVYANNDHRSSACTRTYLNPTSTFPHIPVAAAMDVKAKLRLALGSLRDQAAIGKAVLSGAGHNNACADIELAVLRCTDRSDAPLDDRYVHELLSLVAHGAPASAASLARKLSRRLDSARDRTVALKTLLLLHRLLRGGDRRFELAIRHLHLSGELRLDPPACSPPFLRHYAEFLDERVGWVIDPAGKLEPVAPPPPDRSPEGTLQRLSRCQTFLDRIMDCRPDQDSTDRVTQSALTVLLRESFRVYASFRESFDAMAASFPDYSNMPRRRDLARGIAERAASQSLRLRSFYEDCRRIVVPAGKNLDYPRVLVISMDDVVSAMDAAAFDSRQCPSAAAAAAPSHVKPVEALSTLEEDDAAGGFDASQRLETRISTEWVAFDDVVEEAPAVNLDGGDGSPAESGGGKEESKDLQLLSWVVFDDR